MSNSQTIDIDLNRPQAEFLSLPHKFKAFVAGFGSGKTFIGCNDLMLHFVRHPKVKQGYFAPTYPLIRDIFYPTIDEVAFNYGAKTVPRVANNEVDVFFGRRYYGTVICRTMDKPANIVGFKIGNALVDELDVLTTDKAMQAWIKIIARLRVKSEGVKNGISVTTTPEGFKFVYDKFKHDPTESYGMIQASTYDNRHNLPEGYIESLEESYPEQLISAYLNGQFVNLTSGTVYDKYDRARNSTSVEWDGKEPVYIGMDFNVGNMAAIVHVKRNGKAYAVDEIMKAYDTPDVINIIKQRYQNITIRIYPDASGGSRKSVNASVSDLALLSQAGFSVIANKKNPFVKDRVIAMNNAFCDNNGDVLYYVNADKCPTYADCLEQQIWADNGEPDKKQGKDHANDAGGYFIAYDYPLIKPAHDIGLRFVI